MPSAPRLLKSTRLALVGCRVAVAQLRAARALIRWSALDLAKASKVGVATIRRVDDGEIPVTLANEAALRQALEAAGVEFIDANGGGRGTASEAGRRERICHGMRMAGVPEG